MIPGKLDLICPQGTTFSRLLTWRIDGVAVNLTGYTATMQIRESHRSPDYTLQINYPNEIELGGSTGNIQITISAETTAGISAGEYVYDLELSVAGVVTRLIEGKFTVTPEVTR